MVLSIGIALAIVGFSVLSFQGILFNSDSLENNDSSSIDDIKKDPDLKLHSTPEEITRQEQSAIQHVQSFKGDDTEGLTVTEVLRDIISSRYSDDVIKDTNTRIGWSAFTNPEREGLYGVVFSFKSTTDEFSFVWYVDNSTGKIIPVGEGTKALMRLLG